MKRRLLSMMICMVMLLFFMTDSMTSLAKGTTYTVYEDVYYTKDNCVIYAEPSYTATVLTTIQKNIPVRVLGYYSNGWYRLNIGVIAYCKMDSVTSAADVGILSASDPQAMEAKQIADALGYNFHYFKLNKEKVIKRDVFNSYIEQKCILFARVDDDIAVLFKMVYPDLVSSDVNLNFTKTFTANGDGSRTISIVPPDDIPLNGQIAIFQIKVGYDKAADIYVNDIQNQEMNLMNTYYSEFSPYAYAPVTQVSSMNITEAEVMFSLNEELRTRMNDLKRGIKYQSYDERAYRNSIHSNLRKETEYIDYQS